MKMRVTHFDSLNPMKAAVRAAQTLRGVALINGGADPFLKRMASHIREKGLSRAQDGLKSI